MYDFLLQTSFFLSLGVIIYLMARAVPRVNDAGETIHTVNAFDRLLSKLPLHEIDEKLNLLSEKFLRKLKILVMRSDNFINYYLNKLKNSNHQTLGENQKDLFQDLNSDKKE